MGNGNQISNEHNLQGIGYIKFFTNKKAGSYLKQRLAIAIQRGGATFIIGSLPARAELEGVNFTYI